jgi:hypothetical protein
VRNTAMESEEASGGRADWKSDNGLWLEVFVAFNFACLTGDILLAHGSNRFRNHAEYIPLWFSCVAAAVLFLALILRKRSTQMRAWRSWGYVIGWGSILVGAAGVVYHLDSHFFYERTLKSLTYTAPFAAPMAYMGLGCLLLMNRMVAEKSREWAQWILFFALGGFGGNFVLSLADHATNGFFRWTEWIPVVSSALAVGFLFAVLSSEPDKKLRTLCGAVLILQIVVGTLGFVLHAQADLHGTGARLIDNVLSGAPLFAPLLLPNMALLGAIGLNTVGIAGNVTGARPLTRRA